MEQLITIKVLVVAALGLFSHWLSWRLKLPALIFFLLIGFVLGPVTHYIAPGELLGPWFNSWIKLALAFILFEGGLQLRFHELRSVKGSVRRVALVGVPLMWGLGILASRYVAGLSWGTSSLISAILVVTGPTVVLPILKHTRLSPRPSYLLKWEAILNDPIGALLAVFVFEYLVSSHKQPGLMNALPLMLTGMAVVVALAVVTTWALQKSFEREYIPEYLKLPTTIGAVLAVYVLANLVQQESGLLSVTLFGIGMGQVRSAFIEELRRFKESIVLLMVAAVFILLTANLKLQTLAQLGWAEMGLIFTFMLVVRPLAMFISTLGSDLTGRERIFLAWMAPRGVVAAGTAGLFGGALVSAGYEDARLILPIIFGMVFVTVGVHGLSVRWVAKLLGIATENTAGLVIVGASPWTTELARTLNQSGVHVLLTDSSWHKLKDARAAGVPTYYGEILSRASEENLNWNEFTDILAATENDPYNALVCQSFAPRLGSTHVNQLARHEVFAKEKHQMDPQQVGGRTIISQDAFFERLSDFLGRGWKFSLTTLSDEFNFEKLKQQAPKGMQPVMALQKNGGFSLASPDDDFKPGPSESVLCFRPV